MHTVTGRVVDTRHLPLAGVVAGFNVSFSRFEGQITVQNSLSLTAVTGADGSFQLANVPAGATISLLSLAKEGYYQPITDPLTNSGKDTLPDAVMAACTAVVHGKVRGADGKPLSGTTVVSAEGGLDARTTTDAAGAFTLRDQPEGELLHLVAATSTNGGVATCKEDEPAVITCTPGTLAQPSDIPLALKLLEADSKLPAEQRRFNRDETLHAIADIDPALAIKLAFTGDEPISDGLRAYLLGKQAEEDPEKVELVQLNLLRDPACKLYAAVKVGIAVVKSDPGLAEQLYHVAKPIYEKTKRDDFRDFHNIPGLNVQRGCFPVHCRACRVIA